MLVLSRVVRERVRRVCSRHDGRRLRARHLRFLLAEVLGPGLFFGAEERVDRLERQGKGEVGIQDVTRYGNADPVVGKKRDLGLEPVDPAVVPDESPAAIRSHPPTEAVTVEPDIGIGAGLLEWSGWCLRACQRLGREDASSIDLAVT